MPRSALTGVDDLQLGVQTDLSLTPHQWPQDVLESTRPSRAKTAFGIIIDAARRTAARRDLMQSYGSPAVSRDESVVTDHQVQVTSDQHVVMPILCQGATETVASIVLLEVALDLTRSGLMWAQSAKVIRAFARH